MQLRDECTARLARIPIAFEAERAIEELFMSL
jgi:hypothetical protein